MGTRGLYAYRYRRRYYMTYCHMDSYLEGLGAGLVAGIPRTPAKFKKWVAGQKKALERQYQDWKERVKYFEEAKDESQEPPECPFSMRAPLLDVFIEYTYVIDLDRNVFTVNESAHLPLDAIPPGDDWMQAVYDEKHPTRLATPVPTVSPPNPGHIALYEENRATQSLIIPEDDAPFAFPTCGVLMDYFFRQLRFAHGPVFERIDKYEPSHPDFRAMVQAILAICTWGRLGMCHEPFRPVFGWQVASAEPSWADLSCDDEDTHFWHQSTLIVQEYGISDDQRLRSAVGGTVELWRASQRPFKHATAFVISLKSVVAVHITDDAVSHSAPIELCGNATGKQPPFATSSHTPGFALLKRHFTPELPPLRDTDPRCALPLDVLERVFDMCDDATLHTLAETSKAVRTLCLARPRFTVGEHRLLHHVSGNAFSALDGSLATIPVTVGKVGKVARKGLPAGYNLVLLGMDAVSVFSVHGRKRHGTAVPCDGWLYCRPSPSTRQRATVRLTRPARERIQDGKPPSAVAMLQWTAKLATGERKLSTLLG